MKTNLYALKPLLTLFAAGIMLLSSISADAQNWALPGTHWHYETSCCFPTSPDAPIDLYANSDTIIDGRLATKVVGYDRPFFTYSSGDTAYYYLKGAFRPMFFFAAQLGDSIQFYNDTANYSSGHDSEYFHGIIDSVATITLTSGMTLKYFEASVTAQPSYQNVLLKLIYAERLGSFHGFSPYFYPAAVNGADVRIASLCQYTDSSVTTYDLPQCFYSTIGIPDLPAGVILLCYPSPSSGTFTIDLPVPGSKMLHIYDAIGRLILERSSENMTEVIHLTVPGVYIVEVTAGDRRYRTKVVVE